MPATATPTAAAILERVVQPIGRRMTPALARELMQLQFSPADMRRVGRLLQASKEGALSVDDEAELESYRTAGRLVDLLRIQARRSMKTTSRSRK
ncbi:MAG: hypothetical protein U1F81_21645 [Verrucomicrobiaceae bacterium]